LNSAGRFTPPKISLARSPLGTPRFGYLVRMDGNAWAFKHLVETNRLPSQAKTFQLDLVLIKETPQSEGGPFTYEGPVPTDW
jgi:hypothetical protein